MNTYFNRKPHIFRMHDRWYVRKGDICMAYPTLWQTCEWARENLKSF